jgi:type IV pilus assembly protein PilM
LSTAVRWLDDTRDWFRRRLVEPPPPLIGVEVRASGLGVVKLVRQGVGLAVGSAAALDLPAGTLSLSMSQPNIHDPAILRQYLKAVVERAGVLGGGKIALVLPDPVARVALIPASELQGRASEMDEMLRFRLRKSVPFDIREARVAHAHLGSGEGATVVAAAIYKPILEGYESACRDVGLHPGVVEIAGLCLLEAASRAHGRGDRIVVNWDEGYLSLLVSREGVPVLVRTIVGAAAGSRPDVVREAESTLLYYQERLGGTTLAGASVRSAVVPPAEAAALLSQPLGVEVEVLDPWNPLAASDLGTRTQALAGAAACLMGRAA